MQLSSNALLVTRKDMQLADGIIRCAERDVCFHKDHPMHNPEHGEELDMATRRQLLRANTSWDALHAMVLCDMLYFEQREADNKRRAEMKRVALQMEKINASE